MTKIRCGKNIAIDLLPKRPAKVVVLRLKLVAKQ
jgi:hypothetical protein